ncbi:MAG: hypothetical protein JW917_02435 [Ignavibacteria bacterium]|nr:hypothetical protein [Ignavibacteria bacterium]
MKILKYVLFLFVLSDFCFSQVDIFERPQEKDIPYRGLIVKTSTRNIIDLNGKWTVSFNNGQNSAQISIPAAINFKGKIIFKKQFRLNDVALKNYTYIFVAEGICYESEVYINNNFIVKNPYGFNSIIIPLDENQLSNSNEIIIHTENNIDYSGTLPLRNQIEFTRIYSGITCNIYIMAVPKVFILNSEPTIKMESETYARITNNVSVSSGDLSIFRESGKNFFMKTQIFKSDDLSEPVAESNSIKFNIEDYQNLNTSNELSVKTPSIWRPENPKLYIVKTLIFNSDELVDENISETGISDVTLSINKKYYVGLKGEQIIINGINYHEQSPSYASAITYKEIEKDLLLIKDNGFNCVRVEGKPAHPYLIDACNRIGLFLMEEIPFNNIPAALIKSPKYRKSAYEYAESMIKRDRKNPCIIAWGIGNNFDLNNESSVTYILGIREIITKLDSRPVYYTTPNLKKDECSELVDMKGLNVLSTNLNDIEKISEEIKKADLSRTALFISHFGVMVNNENKNGYYDRHSVDYQAKFLSEFFNNLPKNIAVNIVSSFADWHTERPLNHSLTPDKYLKTDGLYDFYRNPKLSSLYVKRILHRQSLYKLTEGSAPGYLSNKSFIPVLSGIIIALIFAFFYTRAPRFKESVMKSFSMLLRSGNFFIMAKENSLLTGLYNSIFGLIVVSGLAIYFSSLFYLYKENPVWELILGNIFSSDSTKIFFNNNLNNPLISIIFFIIAGITAILLIFIVIYIISFILGNRLKVKSVFSVAIWSLYPFLIFLPLGVIIYKLAGLSTVYVHISLVIFGICYLLSVLRLISGFKFLFEYDFPKAFLYGFIFYMVTAGGLFLYFYIARSTVSLFSLVISYRF